MMTSNEKDELKITKKRFKQGVLALFPNGILLEL